MNTSVPMEKEQVDGRMDLPPEFAEFNQIQDDRALALAFEAEESDEASYSTGSKDCQILCDRLLAIELANEDNSPKNHPDKQIKQDQNLLTVGHQVASDDIEVNQIDRDKAMALQLTIENEKEVAATMNPEDVRFNQIHRDQQLAQLIEANNPPALIFPHEDQEMDRRLAMHLQLEGELAEGPLTRVEMEEYDKIKGAIAAAEKTRRDAERGLDPKSPNYLLELTRHLIEKTQREKADGSSKG